MHVLALIVAVLSLLCACSAGSGPTASSDRGLSSGDSRSNTCKVLDEDQISMIKGGPIGVAESSEVKGIPACTWPIEGGQVQVVRAPASAWAEQLPTLMNQVSTSGLKLSIADRQEFDAALQLLQRGEPVDADQACDLFSSLLELQGTEPGAQQTVQIAPSREDPQVISAQSCRDGMFTSVALVASSLDGSDGELARMSRALSQAEEG